MNERKLLQAIVALWLTDQSKPVDADQAANQILDWQSYGHEDMTRSLIEHGYLKWDHSAAPSWIAESEDRWIMVTPTALGIFEAIS